MSVRTSRFLAVTACAAGVLSLAAPATAKEINNTVVSLSPTVSTTTPCQIQSFKTSSTTGVGDTGLSSISADYQVRSCDSKSTVTLDVLVFKTWDPTVVRRTAPTRR